MAAGVWPQPVVCVPLQVRVLMTEMVNGKPSLPPLSSTALPPGLAPVSTTGARWPQPEVFCALQTAALTTETVLACAVLVPVPLLATNSVPVASLTASPSGPPSTCRVTGLWRQPEVFVALQVAPLISETVGSSLLPT